MMQQQAPSLSMELFLRQTKLILSHLHNTSTYKTIRVVMGDKTCDLDSAVCTLALGLFEYITAAQREPTVAVIPVMNIKESEFYLKTEVVFWLQVHDISQDLLIFRDHINLHDMQIRGNKKLELFLVDHHTLPDEDINLKYSVVKIMDHRQQDISWPWHDVSVNIQVVGSCATLVARNILIHNFSMMTNELASLLRGPILVDTCNMFRKILQTEADIFTLQSLEHHGRLITDRTEIYNRIMEAKADTSGLRLRDLFIKDLKMINGIPIVVLPFLMEYFLNQSYKREALEKFSCRRNYGVIILLGVEANSNNIFRDIAVFYRSCDNHLGNFIREQLFGDISLCLQYIKPYVTCGYYIYLYKQLNVEVTRKNILPFVEQATLLYGINK